MREFCNVWVCVCVDFVMCVSFDTCVGVFVICILVFTALFIVSFVYIYLYLVVTIVRTTATE